ncbi:hypothetical protein P4O66_008263, partial [Electrophorus voltai]
RLVFLSCGGPVLALALTRKNAVQHWGNVFSPKILEAAKEKSRDRIKAAGFIISQVKETPYKRNGRESL